MRPLHRTVIGIMLAVALIGAGGTLFMWRGRSAARAAVMLESGRTHFGKSYPEWGGVWWRWLYELPEQSACVLPDGDMTGEYCAYGQTDPNVFFLVGTHGAKVIRTKCIVPSGRAIFFPIITFASDNAGTPPAELLTEQQMSSDVTMLLDKVSGLSLKVDGTEIDVTKQRVGATKFSYTLPPEPNYYSCAGMRGVTGKIDVSYHTGYWVMLTPLPAGPHEIAFKGMVARSLGDLVIDVVYRLNVQ